MEKKENNINKCLIDKINYLENKYNKEFSNTQKILLTTDGSITAILDVLYNKISLKTINQNLEKANEKVAKHFNIKEGELINNRVIIMHKNNQPLIFAKSYILLSRISKEIKDSLLAEDIPIGRILKNYKLETRREIGDIQILKGDTNLNNIYKTNEEFLSRDYDIIHNNEKFMWIQEMFPISYFTKKQL
ncbi:UbiC family transcriptional regulator [Methanobrevibacter sp. 87.7]|uniref:chorismate--pyruvate lyase family protein n=1 Tax=Methanobrevibacter sp. 87.7 TaxID=387957 RepID=UPI000B50A86E|nr:chorismate lyase [Methanobrevibacter sp. 87.7]OWT33062.1 UbiC family transcriptional regulator [Methanobrevibacter sp. 87.7]